ncbi:MAG: hypothetical protein JST86_09870 [Bacteroidetes bacterium]|nr:hypothetical protein [Bacteroidota bacterium]
MTEPAQQNFEWLIIFLVYNNNYYDKDNQDTKDINTMKNQTKYILNQIRYADYSDKVMTLFVEAQISEYKGKTHSTLSILWKKPGTWLSAYDKTWRHDDTVDILTSKFSFKKILEKITQTYSAKKHLIITAGHGSVVGVNYFIPELEQQVNKPVAALGNLSTRDIPKDNDSHTLISRFDGDVKLENGEDLLFLSNEEINETLKEVFKDKKLDVLAMYNCIMQNTFTQYALRESVDWLVAPLSGICIPGYNYTQIFNELAKNPSMDSAGVAELFTSTVRHGNSYRKLIDDIEGTWKFTATKLEQTAQEVLQQKFDAVFTIIDQLSDRSSEIISIINEVIKYLFSYSRYCLNSIQIFDLGSFMGSLQEKVSEKTRFKALRDAISEIQVCLNENAGKTVVFTGNSFYKSGSGLTHYDTFGDNQTHIANVGILFPIKQPVSNILNPMFNEDNYNNNQHSNSEYTTPAFLTSKAYASVLNKIHALIPMDM